jgi:hypothetical protein
VLVALQSARAELLGGDVARASAGTHFKFFRTLFGAQIKCCSASVRTALVTVAPVCSALCTNEQY